MSAGAERRGARLALGRGTVVLRRWPGARTAAAQVLLPGVDPGPIPNPNGGELRAVRGRGRRADPFSFPPTPEHPFMAPNGKSNIHVDAYQTDTNTDPRAAGRDDTDSIFFLHECASITFDSQGGS